MITQLIPYLSGDFDAENAHNHNLLLSVYGESFSYAVTNNDVLLAMGVNLSVNDIALPLTLKGEEDISYKQVIAGIIPKNFSIIPNALFQEDGVAELAKYLDAGKGDKIINQQLDNDNHIIFNCSATVYDQLTEKYPSVEINFFYKGWLNLIARKSPFNENLYIDISDDAISIASFKDQKLRLYNRYSIIDDNDVVYFAALVSDELSLNREDIIISLSGKVEGTDSLIQLLKEFFRQVEINKASQLTHLPEDIAPQHILALSALQLCV